VSYVAFSLDHHIARRSVSPSLKLLDQLGLIEIEPGVRLVNHFRFSNRWRRSRSASTSRRLLPRVTIQNPPRPREVAEADDDRAPAHHSAAGAVAADDAVAGRGAVIACRWRS
jgi:hypothetical protein